MADQDLSYSEEPNLNFNSKAYLQRYTNPHEPRGYQVAFLKCWHTFYEEHGKEFDTTTATLLEFGGGPTVWDLISAAPFFSTILVTDFAESNRAEVELWKSKNSKGTHNWRSYIEHVVKELEGNDDPKAVDIREQEIRDKIRPTASCDARADNPLGDIQEKFDAIHTNLCLEAVADDVDAFYCYFNNMCQYLKPNGYIVLMTACECDSYRCWEGENNLHVVSLKPENIKEACKRAGLTVVVTQVCQFAAANTTSDSKYYQFTIGRKST